MSDFFNQMMQLRDDFAAIASGSKIRNVYLYRKTNNGEETQPILPKPFVEEVQFKLESVEDLSSLRGMTRIFEIKGVSKIYPRIQLEHESVDFGVDDMRCNLIDIKDAGLTWTLRIEQKLGEQQLYG